MHQNENIINVLNTIESIHLELQGIIYERQRLLNLAKEYWDIVRAHRVSRRREISITYQRVGNNTYLADRLIGRMVRSYSGEHAAIRLGIEYVETELERVRGIHEDRVELRDDVAHGRRGYIYSDGRTTEDPTVDNEYIASRERRIERLERWLEALYNLRQQAQNTTLEITEIDLDFDETEEEYAEEDFLVVEIFEHDTVAEPITQITEEDFEFDLSFDEEEEETEETSREEASDDDLYEEGEAASEETMPDDDYYEAGDEENLPHHEEVDDDDYY